MHIVGFGMDKKPELTRDSSRQEVIDGIKECGCFDFHFRRYIEIL